MNCEAIHCPDTQSVRFAIYPDGFDGPRIIARISEHALHSCFGAEDDPHSLVQACQAHFGLIEATALARHAAAPAVAVRLEAADFDLRAQALGLHVA